MRRLYLAILAILLGLNVVSASTETTPRTDDDLGVNKHWTINENNIENVKRTPRVNASEKIYDFGNILTETEEKDLYEKIQKYINDTKMDMVILTIDMPYTLDSENEDYAADFYDYNDFGIDFEKYSGILLLRNKYSQDPYFNIYTFGNAQLYYDYYTCESILDYIYDDLRNGRYLNGFSSFIEQATEYFEEGANPDYYVDDDGYIHKNPPKYSIPWVTMVLVSGLTTLVTMIILVKKNKMVKKETLASVYVDKNSIIYNNKVDQFLHSHTSSYTVSSSSGGGGGGGHSSHSGSSGGGHGGGGGRHG